jgi:hypothetical protein
MIWLELSRCVSGDSDAWVGEFLTALAGEVTDWLELLMDPERAWFRCAPCGGRPTLGILAAAPLSARARWWPDSAWR